MQKNVKISHLHNLNEYFNNYKPFQIFDTINQVLTSID